MNLPYANHAIIDIVKIKNRISKAECKKGVLDEYRQRYTVDIEIENNFKKAIIRTSWIIKRDESRPRLTTCYVK
jgi:hypothetical protein